MTLDQLIAYLTEYRAAHPEHANLQVCGEAEGGCVLTTTDGELELRNEKRPEEPPPSWVLVFPEPM